MKKILIAVFIIVIASLAYAGNGTGTFNNNSSVSDEDSSQPTFTGCTTYDQCIENGMKERNKGADSVLLYYVSTSNDIKYNLFNNISLRLSGNLCPPNISVYKKVNNINYLLNTYKMGSGSQCTTYFANVTGDGQNRDAIVGQLEIYFCNSSDYSDNCAQAVIYSKLNIYDKSLKNKQADMSNQDDNNLNPQNPYNQNQYGQNQYDQQNQNNQNQNNQNMNNQNQSYRNNDNSYNQSGYNSGNTYQDNNSSSGQQ